MAGRPYQSGLSIGHINPARSIRPAAGCSRRATMAPSVFSAVSARSCIPPDIARTFLKVRVSWPCSCARHAL